MAEAEHAEGEGQGGEVAAEPCTTALASCAETPPRAPSLRRALVCERLVGAGAFGHVYSGRIEGEGGVVAIKHVRRDTGYVVDRELKILMLLVDVPHPNVLGLLAYDLDRKRMYLASALYPSTLERVVRAGPTLDDARAYAEQLARALEHVHALGVVHRDVKPSNVFVAPERRLVLGDFGSAKALDGRPSTTYISSRFYRAPECILENALYTAAIDDWALGCVLAELLTGHPLFPGRDSADQLYLIFRTLGYPSAGELLEINPDLDASVVTRHSLARGAAAAARGRAARRRQPRARAAGREPGAPPHERPVARARVLRQCIRTSRIIPAW